VLAAVGYGLWTRTADFAENWPKYSSVLQQAAGAVEGKIRGIEGQVSQIAPEQGASSSATVADGTRYRAHADLSRRWLPVRAVPGNYLHALPGFFYARGEARALARDVATFSRLAPDASERKRWKILRDVLRDYLAGMTIVTLVVIAASSLFFWIIGMEYPILTGIASGLLNMVPYIGAVMAWLPAFVIALAKWKTLGQFMLIAATLTTIHVLAINLVAPQLVGRRVRLNAVAITIALLFWGWVWGGMGLVLAIPITAALRVICDHTESWETDRALAQRLRS